MKILTSSSLSKYRECPRRYYYEFDMRRVPASDTKPLAFGKCWHRAMEAWWLGGIKNAVETLKAGAANIEPEDSAKLCALLAHYNPAARERFDVVGTEVPFETAISNPDGGRSFYSYRLAGKVDVLMREKETGDTWILDHKTTSREICGFGTYWQALQVDGQMNNYCLAFSARGFVYDVVRKPTIRLCAKDNGDATAYQARCAAAIAEEPDAWYQWRECVKTNDDMAEAGRDLWQQVQMFRANDTAGRFPRNCNSCVGRYGSCPYLGVCTGRAVISDDALFRTKQDSHEELVV